MKIKSSVLSSIACAGILLCLSPISAQAGGVGPFQTEIDCDGVFNGGDMVPYTIRAENQTLQPQPIALSLRLRRGGGAGFPLFSFNFTLTPNQDLSLTRSLGLPASIPAGSYSLLVVGAGTSFTSFDTCSFDII